MSNIAEGFARKSPKQFMHFLDISRGSAAEVQSLLYAALDQDYLDQEIFNALLKLTDQNIALIAGLKRSLNKTPPS